MDRDEMSNLYRGSSIDASYQVSDQLALRFQRRRLKCEKLTKSSPLKPLGQMNQNLVGSIYRMSSMKIAHFVSIGEQTWPPHAILVSDWSISKKIFSFETD
jgi:hypothetical protein